MGDSMWTKFKKGANAALATTFRETEKAKAIVLIESLKMKIKGKKQRFGVEMFDLMEENDQTKIAAKFAEYKKAIDAYREQIVEKQTLIKGLSKQKEAYVKNETKTTLPIPRSGSVDDPIVAVPAVPVQVEVVDGDSV
jgi:hypothetical protein